MYHLIETVFDKPDAFDIPYTDKLKILLELTIFPSKYMGNNLSHQKEQQLCEDMVGGHSLVFEHKTVVDKTLIRKC